MDIAYGDYAKQLIQNANAFVKVHTHILGLIPFQCLICWKIGFGQFELVLINSTSLR